MRHWAYGGDVPRSTEVDLLCTLLPHRAMCTCTKATRVLGGPTQCRRPLRDAPVCQWLLTQVGATGEDDGSLGPREIHGNKLRGYGSGRKTPGGTGAYSVTRTRRRLTGPNDRGPAAAVRHLGGDSPHVQHPSIRHPGASRIQHIHVFKAALRCEESRRVT